MNGSLKVVAMIPARYASTRFPAKMLAPLAGKPVIVRTYENIVSTKLFDEVYVIADDQRIVDAMLAHGYSCLMSKKQHETGSDRIAEAAQDIDCDIIVNVQGDEPFTSKEPLEKLLSVFNAADADMIDMATLMQKMDDEEHIVDPNYVKVIKDKNDFAIYFSRSPIPYPRATGATYYEHVGVYAFRKQALLDFTNWEQLENELSEKVECIRYLEYGKKIKMVETDFLGVEIDTPEDLINAEKLLLEREKAGKAKV